jgi:Tetratricopeptide repeat
MIEMSLDPSLDQLSREELVERARELGANRPEVMTRVELRDEIVRLSEPDPAVRRRSRGWLGVARDLVASVVDAGLKLPGAAAAIRGDARPAEETTGPPPVATLTLAEIYLAQGHLERALAVLDEVLSAEPEHAAALALREQVVKERDSGAVRRRAPSATQNESVDEPLASIPPPEAVREPPVVAAPEPVFAPEPAPAPVLESAPPSAPIPTMAAPSPRALPAEPSFTEPACALSQQGSKVEGHYRLPATVENALLRVVWFVPSAAGPTEGNVDVRLDPRESHVVLPPVEQAAHVRAALGVEIEGAFKPLAVAWVYRWNDSGVTVEFAPPGVEPTTLRAQLKRDAADSLV